MTNRFDIIILGGGNASFGVSTIAAEAGKRIAFPIFSADMKSMV